MQHTLIEEALKSQVNNDIIQFIYHKFVSLFICKLKEEYIKRLKRWGFPGKINDIRFSIKKFTNDNVYNVLCDYHADWHLISFDNIYYHIDIQVDRGSDGYVERYLRYCSAMFNIDY